MLAGKDFIRAGDGATCPKRWETIRVGKRVAGLSQRQKCDFYCCFILWTILKYKNIITINLNSKVFIQETACLN